VRVDKNLSAQPLCRPTLFNLSGLVRSCCTLQHSSPTAALWDMTSQHAPSGTGFAFIQLGFCLHAGFLAWSLGQTSHLLRGTVANHRRARASFPVCVSACTCLQVGDAGAGWMETRSCPVLCRAVLCCVVLCSAANQRKAARGLTNVTFLNPGVCRQTHARSTQAAAQPPFLVWCVQANNL
jgi:hypothetical protein